MEGGKAWVKVEVIGTGSSSTVSLAKPRRRKRRRYAYPSVMAVKSARISDSASLQKEREVLFELQECPYVITCYGDEFTDDDKNGEMVYNLLLEYASGGTLGKLIKNSGEKGLEECEVRRYTRSILRGLYYVHESGYVHLDIKPHNILLLPSLSKKRKRKRGFGYDAKIADFGFAKRYDRDWKEGWRDNDCLIGTPQYMSPESITHYKQEPAVDIWALGCLVAEMVTGKPAVTRKPGEDIDDLLYKIGSGLEMPKIPSGLSKEGQDFLKRCFVRNSEFRWTAEMLLLHPFVAVNDTEEDELLKTASAEQNLGSMTPL